MAVNQFATTQVAVTSASATQLLAARTGRTSVRLISKPKLNSQFIYIGPTNAVTAANGYPLPSGSEYIFNSEIAVWAIVNQGAGTVDVLEMWDI